MDETKTLRRIEVLFSGGGGVLLLLVLVALTWRFGCQQEQGQVENQQQ
jgi:hypothetical protein